VPLLLRASIVGAGPASASDAALLTFVVGALFAVSTAAILSAMVIDLLRYPPAHAGPFRYALEIAKMWALLPVAGIAFGVLPALDAQTKLLLGLPLEWKVTPKRESLGGRTAGEPTPAPVARR
jgi:hypothetical protein